MVYERHYMARLELVVLSGSKGLPLSAKTGDHHAAGDHVTNMLGLDA